MEGFLLYILLLHFVHNKPITKQNHKSFFTIRHIRLDKHPFTLYNKNYISFVGNSYSSSFDIHNFDSHIIRDYIKLNVICNIM